MTRESRKEMTRGGREGELQRASLTRPWSLFDEMERMLESSFPRGFMRPLRRGAPLSQDMPPPFAGHAPCVDLIDRDNEIVVRAELPGVNKKDLEVSMTDNTGTITGISDRGAQEEKGDYYRCERVPGGYTRTLALPAAMDGTKSKATFTDGLLELRLPKREPGKRRRIKIE